MTDLSNSGRRDFLATGGAIALVTAAAAKYIDAFFQDIQREKVAIEPLVIALKNRLARRAL